MNYELGDRWSSADRVGPFGEPGTEAANVGELALHDQPGRPRNVGQSEPLFEQHLH
jgi:hypothetical protein